LRKETARKIINSEDALKIAELLSTGVKLDREVILKDVQPILQNIDMDASAQVTIFRMLLNPPLEPRMTKIAPVMSKLFPDVAGTMKKIYEETSNAAIWTRQVEQHLQDIISIQINDQVRRDIVQCIITDYLINEINNDAAFQKWGAEGGLH
jgi:hypothetical protein